MNCEREIAFIVAKYVVKRKDALGVAGRKLISFFQHSPKYAAALLAVLCIVAVGCVTTPKRTASSLFVPSRCVKMTAESFTRPCTQRADGKLVCDGVVVSATCVEVAGK